MASPEPTPHVSPPPTAHSGAPLPPSTAILELEYREKWRERFWQAGMHLTRCLAMLAVLAFTANDLTDLSEVRSAATYLLIGPVLEGLGLKLKKG